MCLPLDGMCSLFKRLRKKILVLKITKLERVSWLSICSCCWGIIQHSILDRLYCVHSPPVQVIPYVRLQRDHKEKKTTCLLVTDKLFMVISCRHTNVSLSAGTPCGRLREWSRKPYCISPLSAYIDVQSSLPVRVVCVDLSTDFLNIFSFFLHKNHAELVQNPQEQLNDLWYLPCLAK